jgi:type I restriction enzyme S subunit
MKKENNNIPEGYKDSPLGIIPKEWEVKRLNLVFIFIRNNSLSRSELNEFYGKLLNIHYGDVLIKFGSILDTSTTKLPHVNDNVITNNITTDYLKDGDIVIADTAEDDMVGKACEVIGIGKKVIVSGLHTICIRPKINTFAPKFLGYFINASLYHNQLLPLIQGIKVCSISKQAIKNTLFLIPPISEQKKIAEILGTWDEAIEKQARIINLLEQRKRGLMQQLLTGKKRLKGFDEAWRSIKLGEICKFIGGGTPSKSKEYFWNGDIPWISSSDLSDGSIYSCNISRYITKQAINDSATRLIPKGSLLIVSRVGIGKVAIAPCDLCVSQDFTCCIDIQGDAIYLAYIIKKLMTVKAYQSQGTSIKGIKGATIHNLSILMPSLKEQIAIAKILVAADNEIGLITQKLENLQKQKKGLMQILLIGGKRVNI